MKKIVIICLAAAFTGCGIYKPYTRPEVTTAGLYGEAETADSTTLGDIRWQEMFTDPQLQELIDRALENNTDLQSAGWRIKEAEATLKSARLAYLPSFNFAPQGSLSSFDNSPVTKTYIDSGHGQLADRHLQRPDERQAQVEGAYTFRARSTSRP